METQNFKRTIMTALVTSGVEVSPEAVAWADSNLPSNDSMGDKASSIPSVSHLWDDFKGFAMAQRVNHPGALALGVSKKLMFGILKKFQKKANGFDLMLNHPDEHVILGLTADLTKEELAVIVLTGISAFTEQMNQEEKEYALHLLRRGKLKGDEMNSEEE